MVDQHGLDQDNFEDDGVVGINGIIETKDKPLSFA